MSDYVVLVVIFILEVLSDFRDSRIVSSPIMLTDYIRYLATVLVCPTLVFSLVEFRLVVFNNRLLSVLL